MQAPLMWSNVAANIGTDMHQLRTLLCDGPVLLAWVGGFSPDYERLEARARTLEAMAGPLRDRLILERRLAAGPSGAALEVLLDRYGGAALLLTQTGRVVFANEVARLGLDSDPAFRDELRHVCSMRRGSARLEWIAVPVVGAPPHVLILDRSAIGRARSVERQASIELTPRQREVLDLVLRGYANKEIAQALRISIATTELHMSNLFRKHGVDSRVQLMARYSAFGQGSGTR